MGGWVSDVIARGSRSLGLTCSVVMSHATTSGGNPSRTNSASISAPYPVKYLVNSNTSRGLVTLGREQGQSELQG